MAFIFYHHVFIWASDTVYSLLFGLTANWYASASSVDPTDQKKTACYDIDVEVEDPLKSQMNSFLSSTTNQQEIAALEMKVTDQKQLRLTGYKENCCLKCLTCCHAGCVHSRSTRQSSTSTSWRLRETSCSASATIHRTSSRTGSSLKAETWR